MVRDVDVGVSSHHAPNLVNGATQLLMSSSGQVIILIFCRVTKNKPPTPNVYFLNLRFRFPNQNSGETSLTLWYCELCSEVIEIVGAISKAKLEMDLVQSKGAGVTVVIIKKGHVMPGVESFQNQILFVDIAA